MNSWWLQLTWIHVNCSHHWIMICKGWIYQRYQEPSPQFVLEESSMRMICISGSTSNADNHIIDTNRMDLNDIPHEKINRCLTGINLCLTEWITNISRYLTDTENQFYKILVVSVKYRLYRLSISLLRFLP